jgi:hypothetical protein
MDREWKNVMNVIMIREYSSMAQRMEDRLNGAYIVLGRHGLKDGRPIKWCLYCIRAAPNIG